MRYFILFIGLFFGTNLLAQTDTTVPTKLLADTAKKIKKTTIATVKPINIPKKDSTSITRAQIATLLADTLKAKDSIATPLVDSFQALAALALADSLRLDSLQKANAAKKPNIDTSTYYAIIAAPYLPFNQPPVFFITKEHKPAQKDELFYMLLGTVALFGIIKTGFSKYMRNLFTQFFETSHRSKQLRELVAQQTLPSLLMNILFLLSGSIYAALIIEQKKWIDLPFWYILLYSTSIFTGIYIGKYLFIKFCGWVFNIELAARNYIFVVFLSNKMAGILLLPFVMIAAFNTGVIAEVGFTIAMVLIVLLLLYRFFISMNSMRELLNISALHFFLYLCTTEVLPLLLIYKAFFKYIA